MRDAGKPATSPLIRIAGEVLGIRPLVSGMRGILWTGDALRRTRAAASLAFSSSDPTTPDIPAALDTPGARFAWLRAQQGLTEADLLAMQNTARRAFVVWFLLTSAMLLFAIVEPRFGLARGIHQLLPYLLIAPLLAKMAQWSLWHLQLSRRALIPFRVWARNPKLWMAPADDIGRPSNGLMMLLAVMLLPLLSHAALAQAAGSGSGAGAAGLSGILTTMVQPLAAGDLSLQWMQHLFPSLWTSVTGVTYAQDAVAQLMGTLNVLLTGVAAAMLTWHTLVGIISTAHEGKVLGQRWHQIWAPIRVVMSFTAVIPIKGFCLAQLLVVQVFLAGFALANVEWNLYVDLSTGLSGATAITVPPDSLAQMPAFEAIIAGETCIQAAQYANATNAGLATLSSLNSQSWFSSGRVKYAQPPTTGTVTAVGGNSVYTWDYGTVCGRVTWLVLNAGAASPPPPPPAAASAPMLSVPSIAADNANATLAQHNFDQARVDAFGVFVAAVRNSNIGQQAVQMFSPGQTPGPAPDLVALVAQSMNAFATYKSAVLGASGTLSASLNATSRQAFKDRATTLGWASAGAIEPLIVRANAAVIQRVAQSPAIDDVNPPSINANKDMYNVLSRSLSAIGSAITTQSAIAPGTGINYDINMTQSASANPARAFAIFMDNASHWFTTVTLNLFQLNPADPVGSIQDLGQGLTIGITTVWITPWGALNALAGAVKGAATGVDNIPVVGWLAGTVGLAAADALSQVLTAFAGLWTTTATWLLAIGAGFAIVIPMMQYIMWLFAIIGMITYVVEAVVGAAFWAFAHVRMDGAELIDAPQRHGYALCFNALFRPALLVLGLIMGNIALSVMAAFVNATFVIAADSSISFVDPISWIVLLGTLLFIHYQLAVRSYTLITALPDRVARWSGASGEGLGEEGNFHGAHTNIIAGVQNMGNRIPGKGRKGADPALVSAIREAMKPEGGGGPTVKPAGDQQPNNQGGNQV